jgi:putative PIN family toxin of toxin-antitoxin system
VRAIIDTNVFIAGLLWRGSPHVLLEHAHAGTLTVISSSTLIAELAGVLGRAKFAAILSKTSTSLERTTAEVRQLAEIIDPPPLEHPVCRDSTDDHVLALALSANADMVVSGDDDLLVLGSFANIPIVTPAEADQRLVR